MKIEIKRCFKVVPDPTGGAQLVATTLPRMTKMGMSASTDAKEFLDLVGLVEATL